MGVLTVANEDLSAAPVLRAGDVIDCPECGGRHEIQEKKGEPGKILPPPPKPTVLLYYHCGKRTMLAGINNKSLLGREVPRGP